MKSRKILNIGLLTVLLNTVAMGAEQSSCAGGVCFATLANIKPSKTIETKHTTGCMGGVCFVPLSNIKPLKSAEKQKEFEGIKFLEDTLDTNSDEIQLIVLENEEPLVNSNYVMNEEKVVDTLWMPNPIEVIDDKILEETNLPDSDYFCEKDKQPVYLNDDIYECV